VNMIGRGGPPPGGGGGGRPPPGGPQGQNQGQMLLDQPGLAQGGPSQSMGGMTLGGGSYPQQAMGGMLGGIQGRCPPGMPGCGSGGGYGGGWSGAAPMFGNSRAQLEPSAPTQQTSSGGGVGPG